jgi:hypothetical protein
VQRQPRGPKLEISPRHDSLQEAGRDELVQDILPLQFEVPRGGELRDRRDVERTQQRRDQEIVQIRGERVTVVSFVFSDLGLGVAVTRDRDVERDNDIELLEQRSNEREDERERERASGKDEADLRAVMITRRSCGSSGGSSIPRSSLSSMNLQRTIPLGMCSEAFSPK